MSLPSYPISSMRILLRTVSHRGKIPIPLCCSVVPISLLLHFSSFFFRFSIHQISVPSILFCFGNTLVILLAPYATLSCLENTSNKLYSCKCLTPVLLSVMSCNHTVLQYSNVQSKYALSFVIFRQVSKSHFEYVVTAIFCSGYCKYTLSHFLSGNFHLSVCVI